MEVKPFDFISKVLNRSYPIPILYILYTDGHVTRHAAFPTWLVDACPSESLSLHSQTVDVYVDVECIEEEEEELA